MENWISSLIKTELSDLVNLKNTNTKNNYARALCFRLFENNGIIKRDSLNQITKELPQEERSNLRKNNHLDYKKFDDNVLTFYALKFTWFINIMLKLINLGLSKTMAIPQEDGSYKVTGTKIFITFVWHTIW